MGEVIEINLNLLTVSGFYQRFQEELINNGNYHKVAFEAVNDEYEQMFGAPKYSSFNSFKSAKSRYFKHLKQKNHNLKQKG